MNRFSDTNAEELYRTGHTSCLPKSVRRRGLIQIHLLVAAKELRDAGVLGAIKHYKSGANRYGIPLDGKWFLDFTWENSFGASQICLERHK